MKVLELWRYPVASFAGERLESLHLDPTGPSGDRAFVALRLSDWELASPETLAHWRRAPDIQVRGEPAGLRVPGEGWTPLPGADAERALAQFFEFPVGLRRALPFNRPDPHGAGVPVRAPRFPLHLVTTWQLDALRSALPESRIAVERFRPNLLLDATRAETERLAATGTLLRGRSCGIEVVEETVRCGFVALAQAGLPKDGRILKHLRRNAGLQFGYGCRVIEPGPLTAGEELRLA